MKLMMKANNGKEIVYFSGDDYYLGSYSEYPNDLFIMINSIELEKKEYLNMLLKSNLKYSSYSKCDDFVFETPKYYFLFSSRVNNEIKDIIENNKNDCSIYIGFSSIENPEEAILIGIGVVNVNK